jgi:hypothetical protein
VEFSYAPPWWLLLEQLEYFAQYLLTQVLPKFCLTLLNLRTCSVLRFALSVLINLLYLLRAKRKILDQTVPFNEGIKTEEKRRRKGRQIRKRGFKYTTLSKQANR